MRKVGQSEEKPTNRQQKLHEIHEESRVKRRKNQEPRATTRGYS